MTQPTSPPPSFGAFTHPAPPELPEVPDGAPRPDPKFLAARRGDPGWGLGHPFVALLCVLVASTVWAVLVGGVGAALGASLKDPPAAVNAFGQLGLEAAFIGFALLFARLASRPRPEHFGLTGRPRWSWVGWSLLTWVSFFVIVGVLSVALGAKNEDTKILEQFGAEGSVPWSIVAGLLLVVVAPIAEEIFFRGYMYGALRRRMHVLAAAALTGVTFGGIHITNYLDADWRLGVAAIAGLMAFGMGLCLLYQKTGSLLPCIALHCCNNAVAFGVQQKWGWEIPLVMAGGVLVAGAALSPWVRPRSLKPGAALR